LEQESQLELFYLEQALRVEQLEAFVDWVEFFELERQLLKLEKQLWESQQLAF
jgi:hypothetical protein